MHLALSMTLSEEYSRAKSSRVDGHRRGLVADHIAGKIFSTPEEAGVTPPTEEELAAARKAFDEFQQEINAVAPEDRVREVSPKFWDDTSGTEYENWDQR